MRTAQLLLAILLCGPEAYSAPSFWWRGGLCRSADAQNREVTVPAERCLQEGSRYWWIRGECFGAGARNEPVRVEPAHCRSIPREHYWWRGGLCHFAGPRNVEVIVPEENCLR